DSGHLQGCKNKGRSIVSIRTPVQRCFVRQIRQNYSLESDGHEEDLRTDAQRRITFPTRTLRANLLLLRTLIPLTSFASQGFALVLVFTLTCSRCQALAPYNDQLFSQPKDDANADIHVFIVFIHMTWIRTGFAIFTSTASNTSTSPRPARLRGMRTFTWFTPTKSGCA